tara:strand:- start:347 stop:583 length:237 start_codon:yes stop_codon:yes gene_type:complete
MNLNIELPKKIPVDNFTLQKMAFIYNALEDGWDIKKSNNKYIFIKNHEGKKEVYLDSYLQKFIETNLNINNLKDKDLL